MAAHAGGSHTGQQVSGQTIGRNYKQSTDADARKQQILGTLIGVTKQLEYLSRTIEKEKQTLTEVPKKVEDSLETNLTALKDVVDRANKNFSNMATLEERHEELIVGATDSISSIANSVIGLESSVNICTETLKNYGDSANRHVETMKKLNDSIAILLRDIKKSADAESISNVNTKLQPKIEVKTDKQVTDGIRNIRETLDTLKESIESNSSPNGQIISMLENTRTIIRLQDDAKKNNNNQFDSLSKQLATILTSVNTISLASAIKATEETNGETEEMMEQLNEKLEQLTTENGSLRKQIQTAQLEAANRAKTANLVDKEKLTTMSSALADKEAIIKTLHKDIETKNKEIIIKTKEIEMVVEELEQIKVHAESLALQLNSNVDRNKENDGLKTQITTLKEKITELNTYKVQFIELSTKYSELEKVSNSSVSDVKSLTSELKDLKNQNSQLTKECKMLTMENNRLNEQNAKLTKIYDDLEVKYNHSVEINNEIDTLKRDAEKSQKLIEDDSRKQLELEEEIKLHLIEIDTLKQTISELSKRVKQSDENETPPAIIEKVQISSKSQNVIDEYIIREEMSKKELDQPETDISEPTSPDSTISVDTVLVSESTVEESDTSNSVTSKHSVEQTEEKTYELGPKKTKKVIKPTLITQEDMDDGDIPKVIARKEEPAKKKRGKK